MNVQCLDGFVILHEIRLNFILIDVIEVRYKD